MYVIDGAGTDERHPNDDLKSLVKELKMYDPEILKKPAVIFVNKSDIIGNRIAALYARCKFFHMKELLILKQ